MPWKQQKLLVPKSLGEKCSYLTRNNNTHGIFGPFVSYQDFCWSIRYHLFLSNQPWWISSWGWFYLGSVGSSVIRPARRRVMARRNHWGVVWFHAGCICFHRNLRGHDTPEIMTWKGVLVGGNSNSFYFHPEMIFFKGVGSTTNKGWTR